MPTNSNAQEGPGLLRRLGRRLRHQAGFLNATVVGLARAALFGGQFFDRLYRYGGQLKSTARLSRGDKLFASIFFQHREKAEVTLSAATSWYGGDYFEFGSLDLFTFRNMLSAFDLCDLQSRFPGTRFYAFDIFGLPHSDNPATRHAIDAFEATTGYFASQSPQGDVYQHHLRLIAKHGIQTDRCILVQGFFQDTLSPELKQRYKGEGRYIGYAFLDCNFPEQYKVVLEFIYDLMGESSYIYMDEYFQSGDVILYFEEFLRKLRTERQIGAVYMRSAAGFGGLFRLYPIRAQAPLQIGG